MANIQNCLFICLFVTQSEEGYSFFLLCESERILLIRSLKEENNKLEELLWNSNKYLQNKKNFN